MINFKTTKFLSDEAKTIREEVFVQEQKFVNEFDEIDNKAYHIVMYKDDTPIACCRFYKNDKIKDNYAAGRIAVRKEYRGKHLGKAILDEIENEVKRLGGTSISLSAQLRVKKFYELSGYQASGAIYFDEYCEHIHMEKIL